MMQAAFAKILSAWPSRALQVIRQGELSKLLTGRRRWLLLGGVLALGLAVRLWGIDKGLPHSYYPDEAHLVKRSLSFGSGDLNPRWFHKPAFYMYILFFEYGCYYAVGRLAGAWSSVGDFAVGYILDPGPFYLIGRLSGVLFGLATIWVVFRIGERRFERDSGLLGALLLALTCGAVASCQDVKEDIPAGFFATLSMLLLLKVPDGSSKYAYFSAVAAGMGYAVKAYPIVMLVPILAAVFLRAWDERASLLRAALGALRASALVLLCFTLAFFACAPFSLLDPLGRESTFFNFERAYMALQKILGHAVEATPDAHYTNRVGIWGGLLDYLAVLLSPSGMGPVIGSVSLLGLVYVLLRGGRKGLLLCLYPLAVGAASVVTYPGYASTRHQVPMYPILALCGAMLVLWLARLAASRARLVHALYFAALLHPLVVIGSFAVENGKEETRNVAKKWIEANIPAGTRILQDENGPPLLLGEERILELLEKAKGQDPKGQFTAQFPTYLRYQLKAARRHVAYDIHEIRRAWWKAEEAEKGIEEEYSEYDRDYGNPMRPIGVEDYDYYLENGFKYAVVHSRSYGPYYIEGSRARQVRRKYADFYDVLFQRGRLVARFSAESRGLAGPEVKVYELQ
jgi:4-amino-4-deoxy-L-arabinose transferase-like glycosyltransferase